MCKQWSPAAGNAYIGTHLPKKERSFIFPIYLGMSSFGCVVYVHIHREGFPGLWGWRGCGTCSALFAAPGVARGYVGVAEMEFLSQVHPESKRCHRILISSYK